MPTNVYLFDSLLSTNKRATTVSTQNHRLVGRTDRQNSHINIAPFEDT